MVKILQGVVGVLLFGAAVVVVFLLFTDNYSFIKVAQDPSEALITFNQKVPLRVEVVREDTDLARGLSGRTHLDPTAGMLFIFPKDDFHGIWMKDMELSIDIAWLDAQGKIISIAENVRPDTFPRTFEPSAPARYVVETNAFFFNSFNIRVGDSATLPEHVRL